MQKVGNKEFVKESFSVLSGGWGNGSIQNGDYTVNNLRDNRTGSYEKQGVGFSYDVTPISTFITCRENLRIHPDGGIKGTLGCIGLTGDAATLNRFRDSMNKLLENVGSVKLKVTVKGNPNNSGC